jgi:hypothetical protein
MKYAEFQRLVGLGENQFVDFKIECHVFAREPDSEKAKAELAKDICAMANNGSRVSYLLIGVSDDGRHLKSVTNQNLTDDRLQAFCKDVIDPPPSVKVRVCMTPSSAEPKGQRLIAIQIGPNPRHAYRLNRNLIDLGNSDPRLRYCFRCNEVWIRRGATSDLATPEEIVRLMGRAKIAKSETEDIESVDFSRLETKQQLPEMSSAAKTFFTELGYAVEDIYTKTPLRGREDSQLIAFRVVIPLGSQRFVFRCVVHRVLTSAFPMIYSVGSQWQYEHGMFILLMDSVSKKAFPFRMSQNLPEPWGFFSKIEVATWNLDRVPLYVRTFKQLSPAELFPLNFDQANLSIVTLARCKSSQQLRERLAEACTFLRTDATARTLIEGSGDALNSGLQALVREGWIQYSDNRWVIGKISKADLKEGEFVDDRWPGRALVRFHDSRLTEAAQAILRHSTPTRAIKRKKAAPPKSRRHGPGSTV